VGRLERLAEDVMLVELQLPATEPFTFRAGQYIDILLADGQRRSFSIANAPSETGWIELHIRLIPGGHFTPHVFEGMKLRDILRIEGPHGTFWLREKSDKPIVMLAGGTGFAPLKGLVEHAVHLGLARPIMLYWGARAPAGLYLHEMAQSWQSMLPGFRYIPVVSDTRPDDGWTGRRGLVHEAVLADFADLSQHEVYACGAPPMIDAARGSFTRARGLPADAFYSDAFTFAASPVAKD
jgi:CDP-4-dehydro-6-deoxyglucose reductase